MLLCLEFVNCFLSVSTPTPVSHSSHPLNTYVNGIGYIDSEGDSVTYSIADDSKFIPWDYPGNSRDSERLFRFNTGKSRDLERLFLSTHVGLNYSCKIFRGLILFQNR